METATDEGMTTKQYKLGPATYHHGDLRRELVDAATRILQAEGVLKLSLRAAARDAGVSAAAPYHHFADKQSLLAAVAEAGIAKFNDTLAKVSAEGAPLDRLHALGVAYVKFAAQNARLFSLIQSPEFWLANEPQDLVEARSRTFQLLYDAVAACLPEADEIERRAACASAWSLVHGIAVLAIDGRLNTVFPFDNLEAAALRIIKLLRIESVFKEERP